ncbi:hypothetical protein RHGRI_027623 [Rhododendron griersonianum]|uniref:Uncharacterized protein n=1 Tax=Rhododendron griersonianum TaxID=479676 RepID=A0AAV6J1W4_9ERIC|nr:hypothetical protein RHGRI_027623 [Rhododendron griersonianum]
MSPFFENLSFLRSLHLQDNRFQGKIPLELGRLFRLQHLNFSSNSLQGEIPTNLSKYLIYVDLTFNDLVGKIPTLFGSLSKLTRLYFYSNNLIGGVIPFEIGKLRNLQSVEYGVGGKISTQGDVYSYGIFLLEMLTGRRPTDEMFTDRQSLHEFCKSALPERVMGIADLHMLFEEPNEAKSDVDQNEKIRLAKVGNA